jgi:glycosyltransferase involved in cell wall biosynthesis
MNNYPSTDKLSLKKISVTVVIAAFNGEKFILELLESIAIQTHPVDEIVICDDCSFDDTIKILEVFKLNHPYLNIRIVANRNRLGITKNFSNAIKLSKGNLIFLADQDDIWHNNKVRIMLDTYINSKASYIISDMNVLNMTGDLEKFTWAELMENNYGITKGHVMNGCAVVATRKFLLSCLPVPYRKGHDAWFAYCAKRLNTRFFLDKPLMNYRISAQGVSSHLLVNNLKLGKKSVNLQLNGNLKTLIKSRKPLRLIITKLLMHLQFISVVIKFKSFSKFI